MAYKTKHGMYKQRIYKTWSNMKSRCNNPKASKYYLYGGKGIKVCDLTIDRINPNGDYEPSNCRWATYKEQNSHLSGNVPEIFKEKIIEYSGRRLNITQWAKLININPKTLHARYERGWSVERMLETPKITEIKRGDDGRWKLS